MTGIRNELLTAHDVARMLGFNRTLFYRFLKEKPVPGMPTFPKPKGVGRFSRVRWLRSEVEAYIALLPSTDKTMDGGSEDTKS